MSLFLASTEIPYSVLSNNDVTLSILLHKVEYYPLYLDPFHFIISVVIKDVVSILNATRFDYITC